MSSTSPVLTGFSLGKLFQPLVGPAVAIVIAVIVGGVLVALLGQNPIEVYWTLINGSLVGWPNLSVALQMTTPLIFTGLAVAVSFRAGLWNIGAEGQMLVGALFAGVVGYAVDLPAWLHLPACLVAAMIGGALWALVPALLRVYLNVNELVVCLMMNPIALLSTGYVATRVLKAPGPTNKLPDIADTAMLPELLAVLAIERGHLHRARLLCARVFPERRDCAGLRVEDHRPQSTLCLLRRNQRQAERDRSDGGQRRHRRARRRRAGARASIRPSTTISRRATVSTASPLPCWLIRARSASSWRPSSSAR